jgi:hypothetical protein
MKNKASINQRLEILGFDNSKVKQSRLSQEKIPRNDCPMR